MANRFSRQAMIFEGQLLDELYGPSSDPTDIQFVLGTETRWNDFLKDLQSHARAVRNPEDVQFAWAAIRANW